ncbi:hypothetical protein SS21_21705, partial [Enterobacter roggenkampii]|uniref:hypothetical protein n=1 Tax=Enterobacter TaxID=547 RepID=UPI0005F0A165
MKRHKLAALLVTTYIGFIATAHASDPQPVFSPEQEARTGEIAADYLGSAWKTESMVTPVFATPILTTSWLA